MKLILPVGGQSSRFPGVRPKWMLTHPNGNMMIAESIRGIVLDEIDQIIIIGLREHDEKYSLNRMLHQQFKKMGLAEKLIVHVIEKSDSQPHTVYQGIKALQLKGPLLIKDSDNYFCYAPKPGNNIAYTRISENSRIDVASKSYILMSESGNILNIAEKQIISETFCVGGYGFAEAVEFCDTFDKLRNMSNLYVSHIIYKMILDGASFKGALVSNFTDWGTLRDWNIFRDRFCTLFIDLDGILVENSGAFYPPYWGQTGAIKDNVQVVNELYDSGYGEIIITTSRHPNTENITKEQLQRLGIKYHKILFGLKHCRRILVNDYSKTNPFRSCEAINLRRDSKDLREQIEYIISMDFNSRPENIDSEGS